MNFKNFSGAIKSDCSQLYRILFFLLLAFFIATSPAAAITDGDVSFSWQANPSEDNVIGYRLYYGAYSRYDTSGNLKANFLYNYYIDFSDLKLCTTSSNATSCKNLSPDELQCDNLHRSFPKCTVSNLHGYLYFALTAYNTQNESGFTPELGRIANPKGLAAQKGINFLLLKKK